MKYCVFMTSSLNTTSKTLAVVGSVLKSSARQLVATFLLLVQPLLTLPNHAEWSALAPDPRQSCLPVRP